MHKGIFMRPRIRFKLQSLIVLVAVALFVTTSYEVIAQESKVLLEVVDTIALDKEPFCIAVNDETNRVYVGVDRGLIVIDGETDKVVEEIPRELSPVAEEIIGDAVLPVTILAINPQTNRIFTDWGAVVMVFDGITNKEVGEIPCLSEDERAYPEKAYEFAFNPTTNLVYIADETDYKDRYDRVIVYDAETGKLVTTVNIPGSNEIEYKQKVGVAVNPQTNRVYVTYNVMSRLYVLDGNTNKIIESKENCYLTPFNNQMVYTLINPTTNIIYFIGASESYLDAMDGETLEGIEKYCQGSPRAVDTQNNLLYTTNSHELFVLDGTTHETLASLELGWNVELYDMAVNSKTDKLYLANRSGNEISVVHRTITEEPEPAHTPEDSDVSQNWHVWVIFLAVIVAFLVVLFLYIIRVRTRNKKVQAQK